MDEIKLATPTEIEEIAKESDLGPGCIVVSFGPDKAVIRTVVEIDPVYCTNPRRKAWFIAHLETWLRLNQVPAYYFNLGTEDTEYQTLVEKWGAIRTSPTAEYRYKRPL